VRVRRPAYEPAGSQNIEFALQDDEESTVKVTHIARFLAPLQ
jgi:hypothetical protein